ncbi:5-oxoprolinase/urea amidolyase family protein [Arthrobacter sp. 7Tela_A1]|uniref:5-oxoprolinase subunit B/C family protein n=1 Tax=Arthrobacter sp. 7Tela_A1 TaxID=3093745 RepID=UPI003BB6A582
MLPASPESGISSPGLTVRRAGERALLVELDGPEGAAALHSRLQTDPLPGQTGLVPAARTVLVRLATPAQARQAASLLARLELRAADRTGPAGLVELETVYDGEDLAEVARLTGLGSADAVAEAHSAAVWTAAFCGFAPGFAYLTGGDPRLAVPRRAEPRTAVPAGAVALAGAYSAAYPGSSPGGWQLIGRTSAPLWDLDREQPALISPGATVRFRRVREQLALRTRPAAARDTAQDTAAEPRRGARTAAGNPFPLPAAVVLDPGPQSTIQDLGRPGYSHVGVGRSGAADRSALVRANRMVGNPAGAAGLEVLFGGLRLRAGRDLVVAVTGASAPLALHAADRPERPAPFDAPFLLRSGEVLSLGLPAAGLRTYLALRGGRAGQAVLGSLSTDTLAGLGPAGLTAGCGLSVGPEPGTAVGLPEAAPPLPGAETEAETEAGAGTGWEAEAQLRYVPGPREDWFDAAGLDGFMSRTWTVAQDSNRVGVRFSGEPLTGRRAGELESEAVLPGSVQVPPSGLPILFLADAPVTGGYPVIGVVLQADLDLAAQLRPGTPVRFVPVLGELRG